LSFGHRRQRTHRNTRRLRKLRRHRTFSQFRSYRQLMPRTARMRLRQSGSLRLCFTRARYVFKLGVFRVIHERKCLPKIGPSGLTTHKPPFSFFSLIYAESLPTDIFFLLKSLKDALSDWRLFLAAQDSQNFLRLPFWRVIALPQSPHLLPVILPEPPSRLGTYRGG